jgi:hypothetical protein
MDADGNMHEKVHDVVWSGQRVLEVTVHSPFTKRGGIFNDEVYL